MEKKDVVLYDTYINIDTWEVVRVVNIEPEKDEVSFIDDVYNTHILAKTTKISGFLHRYKPHKTTMRNNPHYVKNPFGFFITATDEGLVGLLKDIKQYTNCYIDMDEVLDVFDNNPLGVANIVIYKTDEWKVDISTISYLKRDFYKINYKDIKDFFNYLNVIDSINLSSIEHALSNKEIANNELLSYYYKTIVTQLICFKSYDTFKTYNPNIDDRIASCFSKMTTKDENDRSSK